MTKSNKYRNKNTNRKIRRKLSDKPKPEFIYMSTGQQVIITEALITAREVLINNGSSQTLINTTIKTLIKNLFNLVPTTAKELNDYDDECKAQMKPIKPHESAKASNNRR